ncbi:VID27 cytoplasmic protein-domain-containing protein, partial [Dissophora ornata]
MYQFKYRKTSDNEQDLHEFEIKSNKFQMPVPPNPVEERSKKSSSSTVKQEKAKEEPARDQYVPHPRRLPRGLECLAQFSGQLRLRDPDLSLFLDYDPDALCQLLQEHLSNGKATYWLGAIGKDGEHHVVQPLKDKMNPVFIAKDYTFTWYNTDDSSGEQFTWQFEFADSQSWTKFRSIYGHSMYEVVNILKEENVSQILPTLVAEGLQVHPPKVEMTDKESSQSGTGNYSQEYYDAEDYEDEDDKTEEESGEGEKEGDRTEDKTHHFADPNDNSKNSQLAVGYKDRSFVIRGSKIGVFSYNESDGLDFETTIKNLKNSKNKTIRPSKVLLHEEDATMVMMDPSDPHTAYKMDLEYGKIVDEWDLSGTSGVLNLLGNSKYAQRTNEKTMVGLSKDAMFRIDSRKSGNKIVKSEFKQYAASNRFVCGTTTANGSLAVASAKGDIKLLNVVGKIAKTALPSYNGPIIGMDVTADGRYVLATCETCIQVIDVLNPANMKLGFDASFPANAKPEPIMLTLKREHVAAMKLRVSFTPARFNMGMNEEEKTIVTSTGPYVITWNFRRVKLGHTDYQIKEYADTVVTDNFRYGHDRSIIVALPHHVTCIQRNTMVDSSVAFAV